MTFTKHGLVTSDPVICAMFLGEAIKEGALVDVYLSGFTVRADGEYRHHNHRKATIPYPSVADAIKPVEGKPCFLIHEHAVSGHLQCTMFMVYIEEYKPSLEEEGYIFVAANPVTTIKPGELRELIARVNA